MESDRKSVLSSHSFLAVLGITIVFSLFSQAYAEKPTPMQDGSSLNESIVTIQDKDGERGFIFVGERRFRVSTTAKILGYRGEELSLKLLPLPCRAKIVYQLFGDNRHPLVQRIQLN
jgi:hypothetical protein